MGEKNYMDTLRRHLMTGVSYMIPFVVAGGVLLALSVLLSGTAAVPTDENLKKLFDIGAAGLGLMVPILAGYISFSIAERPGLAPGAIGGALANSIGAGFLGGIVAGLLAGYTVNLLKKIPVPDRLSAITPIFILPLFGTLIVGSIIMWIIGTPIVMLMDTMSRTLSEMGTQNMALLALILGAMIAVDMGGPINKVAFSFSVALVGAINPATGLPDPIALQIMAAVGCAICIPPIGVGIATLFSKKFTGEEKEAGKASILMGLIGITEGAIPFAAVDPLRVIPSIIIGSSIGATLTVFFNVANPAPWGGWIVLPIVTGKLGYVISTCVGAGITAILIILTKKTYETVQEEVQKTETKETTSSGESISIVAV